MLKYTTSWGSQDDEDAGKIRHEDHHHSSKSFTVQLRIGYHSELQLRRLTTGRTVQHRTPTLQMRVVAVVYDSGIVRH
jgi:hypothetical protein